MLHVIGYWKSSYRSILVLPYLLRTNIGFESPCTHFCIYSVVLLFIFSASAVTWKLAQRNRSTFVAFAVAMAAPVHQHFTNGSWYRCPCALSPVAVVSGLCLSVRPSFCLSTCLPSRCCIYLWFYLFFSPACETYFCCISCIVSWIVYLIVWLHRNLWTIWCDDAVPWIDDMADHKKKKS